MPLTAKIAAPFAAPVAAVTLLTGAVPAAADVGWSAQASLSAPLAANYQFAGDSIEVWADDFNDSFVSAQAFRGFDVSDGTSCADASTIYFDVFFGYSATMELQFLFDVERSAGGGWTMVDPSAFYNAGTRSDSFLVNIEVYDGADVTLTSLDCMPDGTVNLSIAYDFTGSPDYGKGPDSLTISGTARFAGIELLDYDQY